MTTGRAVRPARWAPLLVLAAAACAVSCSSSGRRAAPPAPPEGQGSSLLYVAVGASDSIGVGADAPLRDSWPQVLYRTALPEGTVFVNLGIAGVTVAEALAREVPDALGLAPDLVTVWLNVNDLVRDVPVGSYERDLGALVGRLRRGGQTQVLVANTPPLDRLPASPSLRGPSTPSPERLATAVDAYNRAIAAVAQREGAVLVDLHAAGMAARAQGRETALVSSDGFHPSTAGHAEVARAFAAALAAGGGG